MNIKVYTRPDPSLKRYRNGDGYAEGARGSVVVRFFNRAVSVLGSEFCFVFFVL